MTSLSMLNEMTRIDGLRASVAAMAAAAAVAVSAWHGRAVQRRALADLDDRMLRDIGLAPSTRAAMVAKPIWRI
ncbi:MAG: DUF1127 domain-containing protein [Alphaproteobacteria bacterium]